MTQHDKVEHELPNGDILVVDATSIRPEVDEAFRRAEEEMARDAEEMYRELRAAAAA